MKTLISLVAAGSIFMAGVALAKPLSRIIAETGLSPDDFALLTATADAMLDGGTPQVGDESTWTSTESGAKGQIRVRDVRGNCVHLQHFIEPANTDQIREVRTRRCQDADGNWIVTP